MDLSPGARYSSAHLDKHSNQHHVSSNSRLDLHSSKALYPKSLKVSQLQQCTMQIQHFAATAVEWTRRQEPDSSAHLDKHSKQHHVRSNSHFDLLSSKSLHLCFRKQQGHMLCLDCNGDLDNLPACLRRRVCSRKLIGQAHLPVRGWHEVSLSATANGT